MIEVLILTINHCFFGQGESGKMSASDPNSAIYVTDTVKEIKKKVKIWIHSGYDVPCHACEKYGF